MNARTIPPLLALALAACPSRDEVRREPDDGADSKTETGTDPEAAKPEPKV